MVVEVVVGVVVSVFIDFLFFKITGYAKKKTFGFDELLQNLKTIFLSFVAVLVDAEQKFITNSEIKPQLDKLQDVDDADDFFNKFEYNALKLKAKVGKNKIYNLLSIVSNKINKKRKIKQIKEIFKKLKKFTS